MHRRDRARALSDGRGHALHRAAPHVAGILLLGGVRADGNATCDPDGNPDPIAHR